MWPSHPTTLKQFPTHVYFECPTGGTFDLSEYLPYIYPGGALNYAQSYIHTTYHWDYIKVNIRSKGTFAYNYKDLIQSAKVSAQSVKMTLLRKRNFLALLLPNATCISCFLWKSLI